MTLYVPTVATFLQACCAQARDLSLVCVGRQGPKYHARLLIRYLSLEAPEQRLKLQASIPEASAWEEVKAALGGYVRTNKLTGVMTKGGKPFPG